MSAAVHSGVVWYLEYNVWWDGEGERTPVSVDHVPMPALGIGIGYQYKGSTRQEAEKTRRTIK